jgi:hypothetical protein
MKSQAYSYETNPQRACYIRTITARVQFGKKSLVVGLKGPGAKIN